MEPLETKVSRRSLLSTVAAAAAFSGCVDEASEESGDGRRELVTSFTLSDYLVKPEEAGQLSETRPQ